MQTAIHVALVEVVFVQVVVMYVDCGSSMWRTCPETGDFRGDFEAGGADFQNFESAGGPLVEGG
jgi:hypothetical protein